MAFNTQATNGRRAIDIILKAKKEALLKEKEEVVVEDLAHKETPNAKDDSQPVAPIKDTQEEVVVNNEVLEEDSTAESPKEVKSTSTGNLTREYFDNLEKEQEASTKDSGSSDGIITFFMVFFLLAAGILGCLYLSALNDRDTDLSRIEQLVNESNSLRKERDEAKQQLADYKEYVGKTMPLVITRIDIANTYRGGQIETDYGNRIISSYTMYLKPRIHYEGFFSGTVKLYVKLFEPDGVLSTGRTSPYGYSYSSEVSISEGTCSSELGSWGGEAMGNWQSGQYRIEIWNKDSCLASQFFYIY